MTTSVPRIPTSNAGAAIISRTLRGSRSGNDSGGATSTRTGGTTGAALRSPLAKPLFDILSPLCRVGHLVTTPPLRRPDQRCRERRGRLKR